MPTEAEIKDALEKILEKFEELKKWPERLREKFEWVANLWETQLVPGLSTLVRTAANILIELVKKCIDTLEKLVKSIFVIPILFFRASEWSDVSSTANTASADISTISAKLNEYWTGDAATNYSKVVGPQSSAAGRIGSVANSMRTSSLAVAIGGVTFALAITAATATLIAALAAASAAATTGIAAPPAAGVAGVATTTWIGITATLTTGVVGLVGTQWTTISNLNVELHSGNGFPNGAWPKATANGEYSDASVTDGNDTKWKYKVS